MESGKSLKRGAEILLEVGADLDANLAAFERERDRA
jgi:hypothetical protein